MGRRKLIFSGKKNYDRKKYAQIPKHSTVTPAPSVSCDKLIICLPLSSYKTAVVPNLNTLHQRLMQSSALPADWSCTIVDNSHLALNKLHVTPPLLSANVLYMLTIASDFSWTLHIGPKQVDVEHCQLFHGAYRHLCTVKSVLDVISALDDSKFCMGNPDDKFTPLTEQHKGKFMDRSGMT